MNHLNIIYAIISIIYFNNFLNWFFCQAGLKKTLNEPKQENASKLNTPRKVKYYRRKNTKGEIEK